MAVFSGPKVGLFQPQIGNQPRNAVMGYMVGYGGLEMRACAAKMMMQNGWYFLCKLIQS